MIACIGVVGAQNQPLFIKVFGESQNEELSYHYTIHCVLDYFEEKVQKQYEQDHYLGLLYPTQDLEVYGYRTASNIKIIICVNGSLQSNKEEALKRMATSIHTAYIEAVFNPFYTPGQPITSLKFNKSIEYIVSSFK